MCKIPKIKVFGIGGAGCSLICKAIERKIPAEYCVIDDDYGCLLTSNCKNRIQLVSGNHNAADYDYALKTAMANKSLIVDAVKDSDLIILVAGIGGGIGAVVSPLIAEIAKEDNIVTAAIVSTPFEFEGNRRQENSQKGLQALKENANMTLVISCEDIKSCFPSNVSLSEALKLTDKIMLSALQTMIEPITVPAVLSLEYEDVVTVMRESNNTFFGMGIGEGKDKSMEAVRCAVDFPMASTTLEGAAKIILYVEGGDDLILEEMQEIALYVKEVADPEAYIYFALNRVGRLTGKVKVSILGAKNDVIGE